MDGKGPVPVCHLRPNGKVLPAKVSLTGVEQLLQQQLPAIFCKIYSRQKPLLHDPNGSRGRQGIVGIHHPDCWTSPGGEASQQQLLLLTSRNSESLQTHNFYRCWLPCLDWSTAKSRVSYYIDTNLQIRNLYAKRSPPWERQCQGNSHPSPWCVSFLCASLKTNKRGPFQSCEPLPAL